MSRQIPWFWLSLLGVLLLVPSPAGRLVLDVVGGLTLALLLLPLVLGGIGLIAWQLVRRRLTVCPACGFSSFGLDVCPACGTSLTDSARGPQGTQIFGRRSMDSSGDSTPPGDATIDVDVVSSTGCDDETG